MNENTEKETVAQDSSWLKFLTLAAMFVGSNSTVMGMGTDDWIGMVNGQSHLGLGGGRF
ncbi:MAG: hypothetical protein ACI4UV_20030 [Victivallales bacterium]